ncbi:hypothetical protein EPN16_08415 [bacterium]|nr:MAG: hypothetical protein EPN16_08415 [bacterium]
MKKNEPVAALLIILATVGTVVGILAYEKYARSGLYTVELIARSPLNGNWLARIPGGGWQSRKFTVPYGEETAIRIRNIETVSHGFALPDFKVEPPINEIKAGEVKIVKFVADKKGVFPFMCTVWCSNEHLQMNGEMTVE